MTVIRDFIPAFREHLMLFFKTDICLEVLVETGCAKTVKYLQDYCQAYESDLGELRDLATMSDRILLKWKNYVSNTIFDDKRDNHCEFVKNKASALQKYTTIGF